MSSGTEVIGSLMVSLLTSGDGPTRGPFLHLHPSDRRGLTSRCASEARNPKTDLVVENVRKTLGSNTCPPGRLLHRQQGRSLPCSVPRVVANNTMLRFIAGLEQPEIGRITIGGKAVLDDQADLRLPPESATSALFSSPMRLWPHRTVFENVAYGLRLRKDAEAEIKARVAAILEKLGLAHLAERYPDQLSGGQQQRVAICRAFGLRAEGSPARRAAFQPRCQLREKHASGSES